LVGLLARLPDAVEERLLPTDQTCFRLLYNNAQGTYLLERDEASQRLKFSCKRPPERSEEGRLSAAISCSAAASFSWLSRRSLDSEKVRNSSGSASRH